MSDASHSISHWITQLKDGDSVAVQNLWNRYSARLATLAEQRLKNAPKGIADEEDVAASVFHCLYRGAAAGRFENIKNRDDLWWLLLAITKQKVVDHVRRESAQKRSPRKNVPELGGLASDNNSFILDQLVGDEPTPEFLVSLEEEHQRLLGLLRDDRLRQIAVCRIEGFTVAEIARRLQISMRSIERKLQLIRSIWSQENQP